MITVKNAITIAQKAMFVNFVRHIPTRQKVRIAMKTIDEAIKHCEEVAETEERKARLHQRPDRGVKGSGKRYLSCLECAAEHRQFAEWLRELEWRRNAMVEIQEAMLMPASMAERISEEVNADEDRT